MLQLEGSATGLVLDLKPQDAVGCRACRVETTRRSLRIERGGGARQKRGRAIDRHQQSAP
jgi:hypothetical protein